jgi:2-succinyl-5-enolpyruvyl-6-hydroxy-3-cyclohexene-1-carboxylate synthase
MLHNRQHIPDMAVICHKMGIARIVISPGSRNAPLIKAFYNVFGDELCISIVDERSAAYYALGIAVYTQKPVILICTSGTAALNYGPALAEAYYQHIPLLAITADRPAEWIGQQENQAIRQHGIYNNYIKRSYELPQAVFSENELWFAHRMVNEAINLCMNDDKGPVHINVPLAEPLYAELPPSSDHIRLVEPVNISSEFILPDEIIKAWKDAKRIMIVHGQDIPYSKTVKVLASFANDERIIILAENISNLQGSNVLAASNLILSSNRNNNPAFPDLLVHSGGQVVSKALAAYLRSIPEVNCWRIGTDEFIIDTFRQVKQVILRPPARVYRSLAAIGNINGNSQYRDLWLKLAETNTLRTDQLIQQSPFSDLKAFAAIMPSIPSETLVVLANSSIVRYSQIFDHSVHMQYFANRGVSGIDGCISTAAGIAAASKKLTLVITGDLGLIYDSNAMWNKELPGNLKIVVINNRGGGIFHILKGPSEQPGFKKFIEAHHPVNIHKLADAFGLEYFCAMDEKSISSQWQNFVNDRSKPSIFEVQTDAAISAIIFRKVMGSA